MNILLACIIAYRLHPMAFKSFIMTRVLNRRCRRVFDLNTKPLGMFSKYLVLQNTNSCLILCETKVRKSLTEIDSLTRIPHGVGSIFTWTNALATELVAVPTIHTQSWFGNDLLAIHSVMHRHSLTQLKKVRVGSLLIPSDTRHEYEPKCLEWIYGVFEPNWRII